MDRDSSTHGETIEALIQRLEEKLDSNSAELASRLTIMDEKYQHFSKALYEAKEQIGAVQRDIGVARIDFTGKDALLREKLDNTGKQLAEKLDHTEKQLSKDIHIWGSVALVVAVPLLGLLYSIKEQVGTVQTKFESFQPDISKRLTTLEETIKHLTSFDTVQAQKLLSPNSLVEVESSLPKLTQLLNDARAQGKAPDNPQTFKDTGKTLNILSQRIPKSPSVWKAVSAYGNYRSKTEAKLKITSDSQLPTCSSGLAIDKGWVLFENCTVSLDSPRAKDTASAKALLFRNVEVKYSGGSISLPDTVFENALFNLDLTRQPPERGRLLCGVLLTAADLSQVASPRSPSEKSPSTQMLCEGSRVPVEIEDGHVLFESKESRDKLVVIVDGRQLNTTEYAILPHPSRRHVPSDCTGYVLELKNAVQNGSTLAISDGTHNISLTLRFQRSNAP